MTLPAVETAPSRALPDTGQGQKPGHATLLALDGRCLETLALPTVVQLLHCTPPRLDILVTNSPKAATTLLGGLLTPVVMSALDATRSALSYQREAASSFRADREIRRGRT